MMFEPGNCWATVITVIMMVGLQLLGVSWMIYDQFCGPWAKNEKRWNQIMERSRLQGTFR